MISHNTHSPTSVYDLLNKTPAGPTRKLLDDLLSAGSQCAVQVVGASVLYNETSHHDFRANKRNVLYILSIQIAKFLRGDSRNASCLYSREVHIVSWSSVAQR
jgi:hypothetical protein